MALAVAVLAVGLAGAAGPTRLPAPALLPVAGPGGPEVAEPFFDLLLRIVAGDSLGVWTQQDLRGPLLGGPRRTRLPLRWIRSLARTAVPEAEAAAARARGEPIPVRRWRLELKQDLELPMPYSILGYHPGKLLLSRVVEATELDLGSPYLHLPQAGTETVVPVSDLRAIRLDRGWVALDVDAVVDRLLGSRLDDSWLTCFVICRVGPARPANGGGGRSADGGPGGAAVTPAGRGPGLRGLGLARSRDGAKLLGEIDLRADEIEPQGDVVARALSRFVRPQVERDQDPARWRLGDG